MFRLLLSTSVFPLEAQPQEIIDSWQSLSAGRTIYLALDPWRIPDLQKGILQRTQLQQAPFLELAHPLFNRPGYPAASPISADQDEQRAARLQILATLELAHASRIPHLILYPSSLPLSIPKSLLSLQFMLGQELSLEDVAEERQIYMTKTMDHLCLVLEPVLRKAQDFEIEVMLPFPSPWPHQVPGPREIVQLEQIFSGAPLGTCYSTDWSHVSQTLGAPLIKPRHSTHGVRLADACGLTLRLPLGMGEIDWQEMIPLLPGDGNYVLTLRPDARPSEVKASLAIVESWMETGRARGIGLNPPREPYSSSIP